MSLLIYSSVIQDTLKQLQEEMQNITEAQNALRTFSDWLSTARKNFKIVTERTEALDRITMEKKMKRLEVWPSENTNVTVHSMSI